MRTYDAIIIGYYIEAMQIPTFDPKKFLKVQLGDPLGLASRNRLRNGGQGGNREKSEIQSSG